MLVYDYVPDVLERRAPHREGHLALIRAYRADGRMAIGGALGDPPHSALFAFRDPADAEAFVAEDPYVAAGLVTGRRVEPWTVIG
jgi:uncharacterized protein YciI